MTGTYNGTFSKSYSLSTGTNTFNILATDSANNTKTSSITVTRNDESVGPTTGGGGGWGRGTPLISEIETDSQGNVLYEYIKESPDGKAKIIIPVEIIVLDSEGTPLESISITSTHIGGTLASYDLGPNGATFDPSIDFKMKFDPEDAKNKDLVVKIFQDGKWTELETTIDKEANTATVKVKHFTVFALFPKEIASPETETSEVEVTQTETGTEIPASEETPDVEEKSAISPLWIVIVVVAIVAVLGYVVYIKRGKDEI